MAIKNFSFVIDNEILEQLDYEGILVHPIKQNEVMLVMSSKDNNFTLHIYKLKKESSNDYYIK
ncbi:hypothetical protein DRW41_05055 [Neobacillus piezotolerans]|uniref:Uncharacterized protein n=1 Tax=Neobacillus piezotolerans TaxID=2259171 RepID=A0A3D8GXZ4_9BACI|nr:hypothetical protein [Neobacillus piezotolerans]RDU38926.1 hypothetical protein DRW41_05055 [Neobacillus piezotolerans]